MSAKAFCFYENTVEITCSCMYRQVGCVLLAVTCLDNLYCKLLVTFVKQDHCSQLMPTLSAC